MHTSRYSRIQREVWAVGVCNASPAASVLEALYTSNGRAYERFFNGTCICMYINDQIHFPDGKSPPLMSQITLVVFSSARLTPYAVGCAVPALLAHYMS